MFVRNAAVWAVALSVTVSTVLSESAVGEKVVRAEGEDSMYVC